MESEEIPITSVIEDDPFLGEVDEKEIDETSDTESEAGGQNVLPIIEENESSYDIGDIFIILFDKDPILCTIIEILPYENILKMKSDDEKVLSFKFESGELILKTEDYEINDIIKVKLYEPEDEETQYEEISFETDILKDKIYSESALKDDLLSALIQSMGIYDNELLISEVQEIIDSFYELINFKEDKSLKMPHWLIPIIEDNVNKYDDLLGFIIENELKEEILGSSNVRNYRDYLNNILRFSKPIDTKTGKGINTDEYSGIFLRDCLQSSDCIDIKGNPYTYDERRNNKRIINNDEVIYSSNLLRIVKFLEEPINKHIYSVNLSTLSRFSVFEKYIYEYFNRKNNFYKKERIQKSTILNDRGKDNFIIHNLPDDSKLININDYKNSCHLKLIDLLLDDDDINELLFNYNDIEKILFKYKLSYHDLSLINRNKLDAKISENIKKYKKRYPYYKRKSEKTDLLSKKKALTDEKRVELSHDIIFSMNKLSERKYYLSKFIELFTRSAENETESPNYLYNKYNNKKLLCKHHLYEINIENDNDVFMNMKSIFGLPPEDGFISCKVCGNYLCREDTTLFDGYDDDKPIQMREVLDTEKEKELEISEFLKEKEEITNIIKLISGSLNVNLLDEDIYDILILYELLDHTILSDTRYGMRDVSFTDIHPRVSKRVESIKKLEKKEKDKEKKKSLKTERENVIKTFQKWLKDTNKILFLTSMITLYIQTSLGQLKGKLSFDLLNIENKEINHKSLKYLSAKIRKLSEKYKNEKIWSNSLDLFNEKEYGTNEIDIQLGLTTKYCIEPYFPQITNRISNLEEYISSTKNDYLKQEWITFKPLMSNILVKNIKELLIDIDDTNTLKKVYGGITIENSSLLIPKTQSLNVPLSERLNIPQIDIFKNHSFKKLFRYAVSLYGKHPNNVFINLTCDRLINTCDKHDEVLKIFTKNGWNESSGSFKTLNFKNIREKLIPDLLSLYGDKNTEINSCYDNEKSCNDFIHNAINTYDLPLLNTKPKRIYNYKPPNVYPELPYGRLNEIVNYDEKGKEIKNIITRIFDLYKYDEMNEITKIYDNQFYYQFYSKTSLLNDIHVVNNKEKFKKIDKNEKNFHLILDTTRKENTLKYNNIIHTKTKYDKDDYKEIDTYSKLDHRFMFYLDMLKDNYKDNRKDINENLLTIFNSITQYDNSKAVNDKNDNTLKLIFSEIIKETESNIIDISKFLSNSDEITVQQKKRFTNIFKEYNPTERISFSSDNISSILNLFIKDNNLKFNHLSGYINDINNILSKIVYITKIDINLPKSWKVSDSFYQEYTNFIDRDNNSGSLYLHNNIYMKTKDNYIGFNTYVNKDSNNKYILFVYDKIRHLLQNINMIKGSENSKYNKKYSDIYMKYHFIGIIYEIVNIINELKDSQSEITDDANILFQSLELRDEDLIDDMIEITTQFTMDLITHILFQHYDPSWLFLNEKKLDLANRLSKQKEREKQVLIDKFDNADRESRYSMIQKQKMGISSWHHEGAKLGEEYVKSAEYATHTIDERNERIKEIISQSNIELDVLRTMEDDEVSEIPQANLQPFYEENEGADPYEEYDEENEDYKNDYLDDELLQEFNE